MYTKFLGLEKEKQDRIINAAIAEFANMGYDNASTNEIVKEAEISKGILFHYFKNKKQLYFFIFDYLMDLMLTEFYNKIDLEDTDILNRLHQIMHIKLELMQSYPEGFKFFEVSYVEKSSQIRTELEVRYTELLSTNFAKIFSQVDTTLFKEDIDPKRAINIMIWTITSYSNSLIEGVERPLRINYDEAFSEADKYIDMFKKSFYK